MLALKRFYEDPDTHGSDLAERRRNIAWYAFCGRFYRYASKKDQSGEPGRFTPLREPNAYDGLPLTTKGRYDGSVRLKDYHQSYTLHLIGCYFGGWKKELVTDESLIGDLVRRHVGDVDVREFLFNRKLNW